MPLALPALRVFPGPHLSSKQKAASSNTTNKWQAYDKYYHKSAIYDFKLSRSCFKILQQGAYLIGSHRLPVCLIFQEIQAFFIIIQIFPFYFNLVRPVDPNGADQGIYDLLGQRLDLLAGAEQPNKAILCGISLQLPHLFSKLSVVNFFKVSIKKQIILFQIAKRVENHAHTLFNK